MLKFYLHRLIYKSHISFAILKLSLFLSFVSILLYFNKISYFSVTCCKYLTLVLTLSMVGGVALHCKFLYS